MRQINIGRRWGTGLGGAALAVTVLLGVSACGGSDATIAQSPQQAVEKDYSSYAAAITEKNGETAATWVNSKTMTFIDGLRNSALDDDEKTLRKETPILQLTVLSLRKSIPADVLRKSTPQEVFAAGVNNGSISNGSQPQAGMSDIKIDGNHATAVLKVGVDPDSTQTVNISFDKESDRWKFDVTSVLAAGNQQFEAIEKQNKVTPKQVVDQVLISRYGKAGAKAIWKPIGRG